MIRMTFPMMLRQEAEIDGKVRRIRPRRAHELLVILLLNRGVILAREWLIEAMWPACEPDWPETMLRNYILKLRRHGICIETIGYRGYLLPRVS